MRLHSTGSHVVFLICIPHLEDKREDHSQLPRPGEVNDALQGERHVFCLAKDRLLGALFMGNQRVIAHADKNNGIRSMVQGEDRRSSSPILTKKVTKNCAHRRAEEVNFPHRDEHFLTWWGKGRAYGRQTCPSP